MESMLGWGETGMESETRNAWEMVKMGLAAFFPLSGSSKKPKNKTKQNKTKNPKKQNEKNQTKFDCTFCILWRKDSILNITYSLSKNSALNAKIWQFKLAKIWVIAIIKGS